MVHGSEREITRNIQQNERTVRELSTSIGKASNEIGNNGARESRITLDGTHIMHMEANVEEVEVVPSSHFGSDSEGSILFVGESSPTRKAYSGAGNGISKTSDFQIFKWSESEGDLTQKNNVDFQYQSLVTSKSTPSTAMDTLFDEIEFGKNKKALVNFSGKEKKSCVRKLYSTELEFSSSESRLPGEEPRDMSFSYRNTDTRKCLFKSSLERMKGILEKQPSEVKRAGSFSDSMPVIRDHGKMQHQDTITDIPQFCSASKTEVAIGNQEFSSMIYTEKGKMKYGKQFTANNHSINSTSERDTLPTVGSTVQETLPSTDSGSVRDSEAGTSMSRLHGHFREAITLPEYSNDKRNEKNPGRFEKSIRDNGGTADTYDSHCGDEGKQSHTSFPIEIVSEINDISSRYAGIGEDSNDTLSFATRTKNHPNINHESSLSNVDNSTALRNKKVGSNNSNTSGQDILPIENDMQKNIGLASNIDAGTSGERDRHETNGVTSPWGKGASGVTETFLQEEPFVTKTECNVDRISGDETLISTTDTESLGGKDTSVINNFSPQNVVNLLISNLKYPRDKSIVANQTTKENNSNDVCKPSSPFNSNTPSKQLVGSIDNAEDDSVLSVDHNYEDKVSCVRSEKDNSLNKTLFTVFMPSKEVVPAIKNRIDTSDRASLKDTIVNGDQKILETSQKWDPILGVRRKASLPGCDVNRVGEEDILIHSAMLSNDARPHPSQDLIGQYSNLSSYVTSTTKLPLVATDNNRDYILAKTVLNALKHSSASSDTSRGHSSIYSANGSSIAGAKVDSMESASQNYRASKNTIDGRDMTSLLNMSSSTVSESGLINDIVGDTSSERDVLLRNESNASQKHSKLDPIVCVGEEAHFPDEADSSQMLILSQTVSEGLTIRTTSFPGPFFEEDTHVLVKDLAPGGKGACENLPIDQDQPNLGETFTVVIDNAPTPHSLVMRDEEKYSNHDITMSYSRGAESQSERSTDTAFFSLNQNPSQPSVVRVCSMQVHDLPVKIEYSTPHEKLTPSYRDNKCVALAHEESTSALVAGDNGVVETTQVLTCKVSQTSRNDVLSSSEDGSNQLRTANKVSKCVDSTQQTNHDKVPNYIDMLGCSVKPESETRINDISEDILKSKKDNTPVSPVTQNRPIIPPNRTVEGASTTAVSGVVGEQAAIFVQHIGDQSLVDQRDDEALPDDSMLIYSNSNGSSYSSKYLDCAVGKNKKSGNLLDPPMTFHSSEVSLNQPVSDDQSLEQSHSMTTEKEKTTNGTTGESKDILGMNNVAIIEKDIDLLTEINRTNENTTKNQLKTEEAFEGAEPFTITKLQETTKETHPRVENLSPEDIEFVETDKLKQNAKVVDYESSADTATCCSSTPKERRLENANPKHLGQRYRSYDSPNDDVEKQSGIFGRIYDTFWVSEAEGAAFISDSSSDSSMMYDSSSRFFSSSSYVPASSESECFSQETPSRCSKHSGGEDRPFSTRDGGMPQERHTLGLEAEEPMDESRVQLAGLTKHPAASTSSVSSIATKNPLLEDDQDPPIQSYSYSASDGTKSCDNAVLMHDVVSSDKHKICHETESTIPKQSTGSHECRSSECCDDYEIKHGGFADRQNFIHSDSTGDSLDFPSEVIASIILNGRGLKELPTGSSGSGDELLGEKMPDSDRADSPIEQSASSGAGTPTKSSDEDIQLKDAQLSLDVGLSNEVSLEGKNHGMSEVEEEVDSDSVSQEGYWTADCTTTSDDLESINNDPSTPSECKDAPLTHGDDAVAPSEIVISSEKSASLIMNSPPSLNPINDSTINSESMVHEKSSEISPTAVVLNCTGTSKFRVIRFPCTKDREVKCSSDSKQSVATQDNIPPHPEHPPTNDSAVSGDSAFGEECILGDDQSNLTLAESSSIDSSLDGMSLIDKLSTCSTRDSSWGPKAPTNEPMDPSQIREREEISDTNIPSEDTDNESTVESEPPQKCLRKHSLPTSQPKNKLEESSSQYSSIGVSERSNYRSRSRLSMDGISTGAESNNGRPQGDYKSFRNIGRVPDNPNKRQSGRMEDEDNEATTSWDSGSTEDQTTASSSMDITIDGGINMTTLMDRIWDGIETQNSNNNSTHTSHNTCDDSLDESARTGCSHSLSSTERRYNWKKNGRPLSPPRTHASLVEELHYKDSKWDAFCVSLMQCACMPVQRIEPTTSDKDSNKGCC